MPSIKIRCAVLLDRHLEYIGQFTTDIWHITGKDNVVADALSRIESIQKAVNRTS